MPELPEVETVRRGLEPVLAQARLRRVEQRRPDLRFPLPERFVERMSGARIERLERRAKYLIASLDTGEAWITHLGMTGRFTIDAKPGELQGEPAGQAGLHEHLVFHTEAGQRIGYSDPRRFGYMGLIATEGLAAHPWFKDLGPEPLGDGFHAKHLAQRFKGRSQAVKTLLLDQRIVAGLGNIYVCEALFRSGLSPLRPAGGLRAPELETLTVAIRRVLDEAITAGGSTLRDFATPKGELGYFQHRFQIYGREGEPCVRSGCAGVVERVVQGGRSTFHCPACQRQPRKARA